jgi:putative membrane protein
MAMANAVTGEIKEGAKALQRSAEGLNDSADRRTELAADRTVLAAERTYASWVQLGLASLAAGVGAKKVMGGVLPEWLIVAMGTMLVLFSGFCFVAAVWRQLRPGAPPPRPDVQRIPAALLGSINGFLILVDVFAIVGIWIGRTGG